jgi:hypothetical protein
VGFVVDKVALGQVFSEYFGFPCQFSFHQILHHHNHPGQATIGQSVTAVPSGPSWNPPPTKRITKKSQLSFLCIAVQPVQLKTWIKQEPDFTLWQKDYSKQSFQDLLRCDTM